MSISIFFFLTLEIQMSCHEKIESCEEATEVCATLTTLNSTHCEQVTLKIKSFQASAAEGKIYTLKYTNPLSLVQHCSLSSGNCW